VSVSARSDWGRGRLGELIEALAELFTHRKVRDATLRHLDLLSGLRISPRSRLASFHREAPEPANLDPLLALERMEHRFEHSLDDGLNVSLGYPRHSLADALDQVAFGHAVPRA
jgi:hypothetical protein